MGSTGKRLFLNLLLLLVAGGLVWFVATRKPQTREMGDRLYDATMGDNVTQVLIHVQGKPDILIENTAKAGEPDNWEITRPLKASADKDKVQLLFTLLTDPVSASYDAKGKDLARFGLDQEKMSISFNGIKLILGNLNQVSQTRYILKGDKIYLIAESVSALLQSGPEEFKIQVVEHK